MYLSVFPSFRILTSIGLLVTLSACGGSFRPATAGVSQSSAGGFCPTGPMTCVSLNWNASTTPGVKYNVWYGTTPGTYSTERDAGPSLTYEVQGLAPGPYYFVVTAYNDQGESVNSNEAAIAVPLVSLEQIKNHGETPVGEFSVAIPEPVR